MLEGVPPLSEQVICGVWSLGDLGFRLGGESMKPSFLQLRHL